jgi:antitoxin PrlF
MTELLATVTIKGQVTVPAEVRRRLGIRPRDKLAFVLDGDVVRLVRRGSVVARTAGALKGSTPTMSAEEMREAAEAAIADEVIERMSR